MTFGSMLTYPAGHAVATWWRRLTLVADDGALKLLGGLGHARLSRRARRPAPDTPAFLDTVATWHQA